MRILTSRSLMYPALLVGFCVAALSGKSFPQDASPKLKADPPQSPQPVKAPTGVGGGSGGARAGDDIGQMNPEATAKSFPKRGFSPYAGRHYPTRVYWGDEHVHSGWSRGFFHPPRVLQWSPRHALLRWPVPTRCSASSTS